MYPSVSKKSRLLILVVALMLPLALFAQKKSRATLEKEKKENLKRIEEAQKMLQETKNRKEATIGQLSALKNKIQTREKLIESVTEEVELLESEIAEVENVIQQKSNDIDSLKKEYSQMVYSASKLNSGWSKLMYVFSAESAGQMAMRVKYFQHYSQLRKEHLEKIEAKKQALEYDKRKLEQKLAEKNNLINQKTQEAETLKKEKDEQKVILVKLSEKEKLLVKEQEERKKSVMKLEKLITNLIEAERKKAMEAAKKEAAKKAAAANKKSTTTAKASSANKSQKEEYKLDLTPEARALSSSFSGNEGKLPWPVTKGSIAQRFGKQAHPVLKGVYMDNLGVDIQTVKEQPVRTVFQGKVVTVAEVPGMNKIVMIQHGEYFTVYAKLKSVSVKTGDELASKQDIGIVYTDKDDVTQLQFQIWKNNVKLDPERWLYKK